MKDTLLLELATTWELQAETGGDGLNKLDPKACESLRACADTLRMLVSTQPKLTSKYDSSVPLHQQQSTREGLLAYVLQDDSNNCLTPRIVDIAYSAFMSGASGKNKDDGGRCDWFNDTKPMVAEAIKKIEKDLEEAKPANVDDYGLYWRGEYQRVVRQHDDFLKDSAEDRKLLAECLEAFKNVLHFRVTGEGRPPEQTTQDVVKRLNQTLGHWPRSE